MAGWIIDSRSSTIRILEVLLYKLSAHVLMGKAVISLSQATSDQHAPGDRMIRHATEFREALVYFWAGSSALERVLPSNFFAGYLYGACKLSVSRQHLAWSEVYRPIVTAFPVKVQYKHSNFGALPKKFHSRA